MILVFLDDLPQRSDQAQTITPDSDVEILKISCAITIFTPRNQQDWI